MRPAGNSDRVFFDHFRSYNGILLTVVHLDCCCTSSVYYFLYRSLQYTMSLHFVFGIYLLCQVLGIAHGLNLLLGVDLFTCVFLTAIDAIFYPILATLIVSMVLDAIPLFLPTFRMFMYHCHKYCIKCSFRRTVRQLLFAFLWRGVFFLPIPLVYLQVNRIFHYL